MSAKEKSRPRRQPGTGRTVEAKAACGAAILSDSHSITDGAGRQSGFIAGLLAYGAENGQTLKDLEHITGWPGRTIRKAIESERRAGALIISDNKNGYFMAAAPADVQHFTRSMLHRSREIAKTARILEGAAGLREHRPLDGQIDFWEGE